MAHFVVNPLEEFERALEQAFDELLIGRWQAPLGQRQPMLVAESPTAYEIRLAGAGLRPEQIEVETTRLTLTVRANLRGGGWTRQLNFSHPIDIKQVSARWDAGVLTVVAPKL
ncbi:MAG TPA: Hsp20/alpha crystallin family protein [Candidatus Binataceae bacterium]|nr:Hsp20/alpha crystallin family protein [Candidatus Binataceae bacterium]